MLFPEVDSGSNGKQIRQHMPSRRINSLLISKCRQRLIAVNHQIVSPTNHYVLLCSKQTYIISNL